jgi:hypothetical protein
MNLSSSASYATLFVVSNNDPAKQHDKPSQALTKPLLLCSYLKAFVAALKPMKHTLSLQWAVAC